MPLPSEIRIITASDDPPWFISRTRRSLPVAPASGLWCIRSGCWLPRALTDFIPATPGSPCVLIGCTLGSRLSLPQTAWLELLRQNSGLFRPKDAGSLPPVHSLWLNDAAAASCADLGDDLQAIARHALDRGWPVIRHAPLDVCQDARPRLLQVVTSLQRGGAERLVLDQHHELPRHGIGTSLLTLGSPCREPFDAPSDAIQLRLPPDSKARAEAITRAIRYTGSDITHAHLIDGETLARLDAALPLVTTFHNQSPGWPEAIEKLAARPQTLLIGCSQVVTTEIEARFPLHVSRTLWNGITPPPPQERRPATTPHLRLVAIANPRPQKRLLLLLDVLAQLPEARLKIAGEASAIHPDAQTEVRLCQEKATAYGLTNAVEWLGPVQDIPALLAESDFLVSTSLHEGLSLAQLEALACGVPIVTTAVGGAAEIASRHPSRVKLLPIDASPADFAAAIREMAETAIPNPASSAPSPLCGETNDPPLAADFTTSVMAARHAWLLHSHLSRTLQTTPRRGLLLITNNFSTGGAQSSARRLLLQLHDLGEPVRSVVLQEQPDHPTPGRTALQEAGIEVIALDPPEVCDAPTALIPLLHHLASSPPEAILFWNVIPEYKTLLADALHPLPVFDVSPGEMFFASLDRYFTQPRLGLPYLNAAAYGQRLAGVIVKHDSEVTQAETLLQRPVHLIPNGVPVRDFQPESPAAAWVIGTAARLHPHKRLEDLIDAFRLVHTRFPQTRLRIAGGPDAGQETYAETLRQSTQDLGPAIKWCGEIPASHIPTFHDTLAVFAMISEPSGCPNASLEAMASSLPVIATAVGGANQQIVDGVNGFLTKPRDATSLAEAMIRLLTDSDLRHRMRVAVHERAGSVYSMEVMTTRYRDVYFSHIPRSRREHGL